MEKIKFFTRDEYSTYLKNLLSKVSANGEYNFFIHQVFLFGKDEMMEGADTKCNSILNTGMIIRKYPTIFGTMRLIGETNNFDTNKFIDYFYASNANDVYSIIFAIPKNIKLNDKTLNFSGMTLIENQNLDKLRYNRNPDSTSAMHNVLDTVKGLNRLDSCFILGYQHIDKTSGKYEFKQNENLFYNFSNDKKQSIMNEFSLKFENLLEKYRPQSFQDMLLISTEEWHKDNDKCIIDEI